MKTLALCLAAGALIAGCGSDDGGSAKAPKAQSVAAAGNSAGQAGVAAQGKPSPASLCTTEGRKKAKGGKGKSPFAQCVSGLGKLNKGKAQNPHEACKGLSKKKAKGTKGKSPYAVCVTAAAKLMASKNAKSPSKKSKGKAGGDTDGSDGADDTSSGSGQLLCTDEKGNEVAADSPDVDDCSESAEDAADEDSANAKDSSDDADSADDSADDDSGSLDDGE